MTKKTVFCLGVVILSLGYLEAKPAPAGPNEPVVLGEWHSNLAAAQAQAEEWRVPLLVLWGKKTCSQCSAFDKELDKTEFVEYLSNRGLVMVYGKDDEVAHNFVGRGGSFPLWRVVWTAGGVNYKGEHPKTLVGFRAELEAQIGDYVPGAADTSKDAYDPASDAAATAPTLAWSEQAVTASLRLSHSDDYTDVLDWYKMSVEKGKTYKVWFSQVRGQSADSVQVALYGDADGTRVIAAPVSLASGDFTFFAPAADTVYVKVWRTTANDDAIQYAMSYQLKALGRLTTASYQGWVSAPEGEGVLGTVNLSVSSSGKLSGKAVFPKAGQPYDGSYTLSDAASNMISNDTMWVSGFFAKSGSQVPVQLGISVDSGRISGSLGQETNAVAVNLYRDDWKQSEWVAVAEKFDGYYTVSFPNCCSLWPDDAPAGSGFATLTLDKKGRYKVAGVLGDGTKLTQSGVLFLHPDATLAKPVLCAVLYSAPTTYNGGTFGGVISFGDQNTNGVIDVSLGNAGKIVWRSRNPFSVPNYDEENPGFEATLDVYGGWYDRTENLKTHYANKTMFVEDLQEPAPLKYTLTVMDTDGTEVSVDEVLPMCWQSTATNLTVFPKADGSGFTVPAADLKKAGYAEDGQPLYNYESGMNPNGVKLAFNRATGVMSGSFKVFYDYFVKADYRGDSEKLTWKHTEITATYASILMLEQVDATSDLVSLGHYLLPDSATYETATGAVRKYALKRSYEFVVRATENE